MVRPLLADRVLRDAERSARSAPAGRSSSPGRRRACAASASIGSNSLCTTVVRDGQAELAGRPRRAAPPACRRGSRLVPAAGDLLAAAEPDVRAQAGRAEPAGDVGERAHVDHRGAQLGQLALGQVGVAGVERVGDRPGRARRRRGTPAARWSAARRSRTRTTGGSGRGSSSSASKVTPSASSSEDGSADRSRASVALAGLTAQTARTCRPSYVPQVGHAVCGSFGLRQARFSHGDQRRRRGLPLRAAGPGVAARHLALRDGHCLLLTLGGLRADGAGRGRRARPSGGRRCVVRVVRRAGRRGARRSSGHSPRQSSRHSGASGRASTTASRTTGSRSRRSPTRWLTSSSSVVSSVVVLLVREQLLNVDGEPRRRPARGSGRTRRPPARGHRAGDQHALDHRLQPEVQLERRAGRHPGQLDAEVRRRRHGAGDGPHRPRAPAQLAHVEHEGPAGVEPGRRLRRHGSLLGQAGDGQGRVDAGPAAQVTRATGRAVEIAAGRRAGVAVCRSSGRGRRRRAEPEPGQRGPARRRTQPGRQVRSSGSAAAGGAAPGRARRCPAAGSA